MVALPNLRLWQNLANRDIWRRLGSLAEGDLSVLVWRHCTDCCELPVLWMTSPLSVTGSPTAPQVGRLLSGSPGAAPSRAQILVSAINCSRSKSDNYIVAIHPAWELGLSAAPRQSWNAGPRDMLCVNLYWIIDRLTRRSSCSKLEYHLLSRDPRIRLTTLVERRPFCWGLLILLPIVSTVLL